MKNYIIIDEVSRKIATFQAETAETAIARLEQEQARQFADLELFVEGQFNKNHHGGAGWYDLVLVAKGRH